MVVFVISNEPWKDDPAHLMDSRKLSAPKPPPDTAAHLGGLVCGAVNHLQLTDPHAIPLHAVRLHTSLPRQTTSHFGRCDTKFHSNQGNIANTNNRSGPAAALGIHFGPSTRYPLPLTESLRAMSLSSVLCFLGLDRVLEDLEKYSEERRVVHSLVQHGSNMSN